MSLADLLKEPLRRLNPFRGLVMDVPAWNAAHEYHRRHQQLHAVAMHSPGVVTGLDVVGWAPPDNSVLIYPGMAVDPDGNVITITEPERFYLSTETPGTAQLVLRQRSIPQDLVQPPGGEQPQPRYYLEAFTLEEYRVPPEGAYVELARVEVSGARVGLTDAAMPYAPEPDEIDTRHRPIAGHGPKVAVSVGIVALERTDEGDARHQAGALALVKTINDTTAYCAEFIGEVSLDEDLSRCQLLIIAAQQGFTLKAEEAAALSDYLAKGGVVFAECCLGGRAAARRVNTPQQSFGRLADVLGSPLSPVERSHELLVGPYRFGQPPIGPDGPGLVLAAGGFIYSEADYGCLWDGGRPGEPFARDGIRNALELGVNLCIFSAHKSHNQSIHMRNA